MLNKEKPVKLNITKETCTNCGYCAENCSAGYLDFSNNIVEVNKDALFGCIQCGNCMMSCPSQSIEIKAENMSKDDIITLNNNLPDFEAVYSLFAKRRSTRKFKNKEISKEIIDKILEAAVTAPISIPPSEVKVLVINGFDKVQDFADDLMPAFKKTGKIMNPILLKILKPFIGKINYKMFNDFVVPLIKTTVEERKKGKDILFYNAPAVIVFYGTPYCGKEDQILAATHAYIAAESLGLGTCIIGTVPPILEISKKLKAKYGVLKDEKSAIAFVVGYPDIKFQKGIKRHFKKIKFS
jgi:nitroreductase/NAD-dependent dihydropyrimidine dehydrogenase PreA subunit